MRLGALFLALALAASAAGVAHAGTVEIAIKDMKSYGF